MGDVIRAVEAGDRHWIERFVTEGWGADLVVAHGAIYRPSSLPGFIALEDGQLIGLITFSIGSDSCEIVTLDSLRPGRGIGTALIQAVKEKAAKAGCTRLWLITTNDNLNALRFYQKRGFYLAAIHCNAITESRRIKPQIPLVGNEGIPLRDEIELEMTIGA